MSQMLNQRRSCVLHVLALSIEKFAQEGTAFAAAGFLVLRFHGQPG
jgi:hypothetical protein